MKIFPFLLYQLVFLCKLLDSTNAENDENGLQLPQAKQSDHIVNILRKSSLTHGRPTPQQSTAKNPEMPQSVKEYFIKGANSKPINPSIRSIRPPTITQFGRSAEHKPTSQYTRYGRSIRPHTITQFGRSADIKRTSQNTRYGRSIKPQSITRFGGSADIKCTSPYTRYGLSIRPQSITRFGRSANNKPASQYTRYGRSIRPQSITRLGRSADDKTTR